MISTAADYIIPEKVRDALPAGFRITPVETSDGTYTHDIGPELRNFSTTLVDEIATVLDQNENNRIEIYFPVQGSLVIYDLFITELKHRLQNGGGDDDNPINLTSEHLERINIRFAHTDGGKSEGDKTKRIAYLDDNRVDYPEGTNLLAYYVDDMKDNGHTEESIFSLITKQTGLAAEDIRNRTFSYKNNQQNAGINISDSHFAVAYPDEWIYTSAGLNSNKTGISGFREFLKEKHTYTGDIELINFYYVELKNFIEIEILERFCKIPVTAENSSTLSDKNNLANYKQWLVDNSMFPGPLTNSLFRLILDTELYRGLYILPHRIELESMSGIEIEEKQKLIIRKQMQEVRQRDADHVLSRVSDYHKNSWERLKNYRTT